MATDYEKKYKEALERAKRLTSDMTTLQKIREFIFPELKESEDERIRKTLINALKTSKSVGELKFILPEPTREECLAYLEKQKEQNSVEWSEEDEKKMIFLERLIEHNVPDGQYGWVDGMKGGFVTKSEAISMLKSLRPRYHGDVTMTEAYKMGKEEGEASHWKPSEKEITAFENMLKGEFHDNIFPGATLSGLLTKLKKLYYNESIPSWKPSEEQMKALSDACCIAFEEERDFHPSLSRLHHDLRKL